MSFPAFGSLACASVLVKSDAGITAVLPSFVVTVAFPLSSTTTVEPGFTASTAFLTASFSASVSCSGFATTALSAGLFTLFPASGLAASDSVFTKSFAGIVATAPSFVVTVAFPNLSNTTLASGFTS